MKKCICGSTILFDNGRVLLIKHKKLGVWLNPGGHVEENETPLETALRETFEETGISAEIIDPDHYKTPFLTTDRAYELPRPFYIMHQNVEYKSGTHEHFDLIYVARLHKSDSTGAHSNSEGLEMRWFEESEIDSLDTYEIVKATLHRVFEVMKTIQ